MAAPFTKDPSKKAPAKRSTKAEPTKRAPRPKIDPTADAAAIGLTEREAAISRALWKSLVPGPDAFDNYVPRDVWGYEDLSILDAARDLQHNVLLFGPTGPGKSAFFRAAAARDGVALATVGCNGASDPSLWFGDYRYLGGEWVWVDGIVTVVFRYGGLAFFDELNFLRPEISASVHQAFRERELVLERKGNEKIKAADDTLICAAYNDGGGYAGTNDLNAAVKNRFAIQIPWGYDDGVERELVDSPTLLAVAQALRQAGAEGVIETPTSTNALIEFEEIAASYSIDFAIANFVARFEPEERPVVENILELNQLADRWVGEAGGDEEEGE